MHIDMSEPLVQGLLVLHTGMWINSSKTAPCSKIWVDCSPAPSSLRDQGALRPWIILVSGEMWGWGCPEPLGGHGRRDWRKQVQEVQETWVDPWVRKTSLEESTAIHFSILPWKIPWTEEPGRLESIESDTTEAT